MNKEASQNDLRITIIEIMINKDHQMIKINQNWLPFSWSKSYMTARYLYFKFLDEANKVATSVVDWSKFKSLFALLTLNHHFFLGLHYWVFVSIWQGVVHAWCGCLQFLFVEASGLLDPLLVQNCIELGQRSIHIWFQGSLSNY